ncbi:TIGR00341 family protein [Reichenbachiella versicolor]|uniref:TIGR00341 family protein n=1 Tax=Reichenbachiella versicolor TaxID=1821036 RepID=UPI000D6E8A1E|nr:TIGR00341 family protein [Reichenbachiella versicolor]
MLKRRIQPIEGLKAFVHDLFDLHEDKQRETKTIEDISKGVEFKGTNLWILIFAIIIASVGLNVNSTAVIIGAMLISPLMGPIMGIGLGAGINDFELIKKAFWNLSVAVTISILTSAIYFWVTPLHEAQSELLARTNPTLWDVMIAFFGGLAGIIAGSRKEKSNAIPGVAIATALMPPLCTAGYALANMNWYFFLGAFYLFFINSVFITFATFLIVRFLNYPKKKFDDPSTETHVKRLIAFFVVLTTIPSVYLAYHLVQKTLFEQNARKFVSAEFSNWEETEVINKDVYYSADSSAIEVTLYGRPLSAEQVKDIERQLPIFNLGNANLVIHQGYKEELNFDAEFAEMSSKLKVDIIEDLYKDNKELIASKDKQIALLEKELIKRKSTIYPVEAVAAEMQIHYSSLTELAISDVVRRSLIDSTMDTVAIAMVKFKKPIRKSEKNKMQDWLRIRLDRSQLEVLEVK